MEEPVERPAEEALVGVPVRVETPLDGVQDDGPLAPSIDQRGVAAPPLNIVCCVGAISIWMSVISIVCMFLAMDISSMDISSMMAFVSVGCALLDIPLSCLGIFLVTRRHRIVPGGCECFRSNAAGLPWVLLIINALWASRTFTSLFFLQEGLLLLQCLALLVKSSTAIAFALTWMQRLRQQRRALAASATCGAADGRVHQMSAASRFSAIVAADSRRFEAAYLVAETLLLAAYIVYAGLDGGGLYAGQSVRIFRLQIIILPGGILFRLYRCSVSLEPSWRMDMLNTAVDTFLFAWNVIMVSHLGPDGHTSFFVNVTLSYLLIFVFPLKRALVVIPVCYTAYCAAAVASPQPGPTRYLDLALLGVGLCLSFATKRMVQNSKWEAFLMLEEKSAQVVQETVLRFQAEFAADGGLAKPAALSRGDSSYLGDGGSTSVKDLPSVADRPLSGRRPLSARSAPTLLWGDWDAGGAPDGMALDCAQGDCLPPDARVWVEGEPRPKPLHELQPGSRVLCYDRLGGSLKHATLTDVKLNDGPVDWALVRLADGTALKMTCDHPLQPATPGPWQALGRPGAPVTAGELQPGQDSLTVLKVAPVLVEAVTCTREHGQRVALTVQQPDRHAIFVAGPGAGPLGADLQNVAVESADVRAHECLWLGERGSFLELAAARQRAGGAKHPASAPPSLAVQACGAPAAAGQPDGAAAPNIRRAHSEISSSSSMGASSGAEVLVGSPVRLAPDARSGSARLEPHPAGRWAPARVSDLLRLRVLGWPSLGSQDHQQGDCKPCIFENRRQQFSERPCIKGPFCERCHDHHDCDLRKQKRDTRRQRRREAIEAGRLAQRLQHPQAEEPAAAATPADGEAGPADVAAGEPPQRGGVIGL